MKRILESELFTVCSNTILSTKKIAGLALQYRYHPFIIVIHLLLVYLVVAGGLGFFYDQTLKAWVCCGMLQLCELDSMRHKKAPGAQKGPHTQGARQIAMCKRFGFMKALW